MAQRKLLLSVKRAGDLGLLMSSGWRTVKNAVSGLLMIRVCVGFFLCVFSFCFFSPQQSHYPVSE